MIPRHLHHFLVRDRRYYPVLTITGPRQSGKTTLVRAAFPKYQYISLEDTEARAYATSDPRGFLKQYPRNVIFDEVQRVPNLFSHIQVEVDRDPKPGRFILTGSQNFLLSREISQTLAGRCGILNLLPFSRAELEKKRRLNSLSPPELFSNRSTKFNAIELIRSGFYPPVHDRKIPPEIWLGDYIRTYVERDLRQIVNVGELETFERFLALCAGRVGQLLNYSSLASDCGIAVDTAKRWVSVLKTSFIIFLLRPHHRNFSKRIIKSPKLYFVDTGLACHLLGIRTGEQAFTHPLFGALFENLVIGEVVKTFYNARITPPVYFWRDQTGHEVDLIIEEAGRLSPLEIKAGMTVGSDMFAGLKWWRSLAKKSAGNSMLIYGGSESYTREDVTVRPWFSI